MALLRIGFCLLALLAVGHCTNDDSTIAEDIITETKPVGATGRLNCTVTNKRDSDKVLWRRIAKGGIPTKMISRDETITVKNPIVHGQLKYQIQLVYAGLNTATTVYMLLVRRVTEEDDGMYECQISKPGTDYDTWPSRQGRLYVQRPPFIDKSQTTPIIFAKHGTSVTLVCAANGRPQPKIMWTRIGSHYLKGPDGNYVPRLYGKNYTVSNVEFNDRGLYRCMADNNVRPPAVFDITLNVQYPPTAKAFRPYVGQAADRNYVVELNCRITGAPSPNAGWYKLLDKGKEQKLLDSEKHDVDLINSRGPYLAVGESWMILRVRRLQMGDFGNYSCRAENKYGKANDTIRLFGTRTCQGPNCYNFEHRLGASGLQMTMTTIIMTTMVAIFLHGP